MCEGLEGIEAGEKAFEQAFKALTCSLQRTGGLKMSQTNPRFVLLRKATYKAEPLDDEDE